MWGNYPAGESHQEKSDRAIPWCHRGANSSCFQQPQWRNLINIKGTEWKMIWLFMQEILMKLPKKILLALIASLIRLLDIISLIKYIYIYIYWNGQKVQVFPQQYTKTPEWTFWPTQYIHTYTLTHIIFFYILAIYRKLGVEIQKLYHSPYHQPI